MERMTMKQTQWTVLSPGGQKDRGTVEKERF